MQRLPPQDFAVLNVMNTQRLWGPPMDPFSLEYGIGNNGIGILRNALWEIQAQECLAGPRASV